MKINFTHNLTYTVKEHGNIRPYLHRFKIIETPTCPCGTKDHKKDQWLFECELLNKEQDSLNSSVLKTDIWTISRIGLIRKHFKIHIHTHIYTNTHACIYTYIYTNILAYTHTYMQTYIHTLCRVFHDFRA